ncbi:NHL repeat protein [compost metagenome]
MIPKTTGTYFGQSRSVGKIYTIVGNGTGSFAGDGNVATNGSIRAPQGLAFDAIGNLYFADSSNNRIRMMPKTTGTYYGQSMTANYLYTIAGNGTGAYGGDGTLATSGSLRVPIGLTFDNYGHLLIADGTNQRIRMVTGSTGSAYGQSVTAGYLYTIAGNGTQSFAGDSGQAISAQFNNPSHLAYSTTTGRLYVADLANHRIRILR